MRFIPGFWRKCRIAFRCLRIAVWLLVLATLLAGVWLNLVGLPDFLKTRLTATLRERGVELEFSRMRLSFLRGLVVENVHAGQLEATNSPTFSAQQVQLKLNYPALLHRTWQLDGLVLHHAQFSLPLSPTNVITLTNLQTELRFQADDTWSLDHFSAHFAGTQIAIRGEMAHAPEARKWKIFSGIGGEPGGEPSGAPGASQNSLKLFSDALKQIQFQDTPLLLVTIAGDARDVHSIQIRLNAAARAVRTPWFTANKFNVAADLTAPRTAPTNFAAADNFWTNLQPFRLAWVLRLGELHTAKLDASDLTCAGVWAAPELKVSQLSAQLARGKIEASATLDVSTRTVSFTNNSSFDPHALAALLPEKARAELAQISCPQPPQLNAGGQFKLPTWTAPADAWPDAIKNSLALNGEFAATNLARSDVLVDAVQTHFSFANLMLTLPDFTVAQGQTRLTVSGQLSEATQNFRCRFGGTFAAESVRPFLKNRGAVRSFGHLAFHEPLAFALEANGNLRSLNTVSASGQFALTNAAIRGQTVDRLTAGVTYSNLTVEFLQPQLVRADGAQFFSAAKVLLDLADEKILITDGVGRVEPMVVGRAIGPKTAEAMTPYQFLAVPDVRVNGWIPIKQTDGEVVQDAADLRVDIVGTTPFRWRRFETPAITGTIHWRKTDLIITNTVTECYGGTARGWGIFDVGPAAAGTDFQFFITGTNADFNRMATALWFSTNQVAGELSGTATVTRANSDDWRTWNGFGSAQLHKGLIWDVPIFGIISPALNTLLPGLELGNNRATEAAGNFVMTNGVIFTDSLVIQSAMARLDYVGTVDLEQKLQARVTAQLLRNTPVVGSLFSKLLWPVSKAFECEVTGTLGEPKPTPIHVPAKLLLLPLHPFRTVEEWFTPSPTNAPAGK